ncbi:MAG TPA: PaaI family thioesterase [Thermomicrobiaceae bacterium]|nr:PaaI family thioesterase [Thermomicrobiaceae bacterium]
MSERRVEAVAWFQEKFRPFVEGQRLEVEERAPGEFVVRLPQAAPWQRGGGGTDALNGGVIAYMFDGAMGGAVASAALARADLDRFDLSRFGQVTVSLTINYLSAALGDRFEAHGSVTKLGRGMAFAEGRFYDQSGELCATATGVWRLFLPRES